ncbi:MAG: hypothetical protein V7K69_17220 [Nostoc sp.]|uniref:hypothetical protein n=1 Tax=Nostoc sp. TaxID=1180 RepID=UPI002FF68E5E
MGDKQGAMSAATPEGYADLRINPNLLPVEELPAYTGRGIVRYILGDKQGAIADLQKAADLDLEPHLSGHLENLTSISLS